MKISWRWLERHVDLGGLTPQGVADDLTLSVAEVEGLEPFAPVLADVTVGHVLERERHPDADKLSVCRVDVGAGEPLQIVCGAPNVRAGLRVAVATVGTALGPDFKIKKSKIRGVESQGMICSERELGLGEEHDGIWELPGTPAVGERVGPALGVSDWVIEIDNKSITHRPDLWGHRGIAAEIAAIHRRPLRPLNLTLPETGGGAPFAVRIESARCSRYVALPIDGARAEKSPTWLRLLLLAVGQRPIDVLVDLSNFVMLDLGEPNHVFDRTRLAAGIEVREAGPGERMTTLDGVDRALATSDLVIASGGPAVALAGIMGGEASKVGSDTSRLLLEAATFDAASVRRTSARLGLRTDASARFEKSLDPHLPVAAAAHFARLLLELQPQVRLPAPATDVGAWQDPALELSLRPARVRGLLGVAIEDHQISDILTRLGFGVAAQGTGSSTALRVRVPAARATKDIGVEQDLIEEVGRIWRYGNVPEAELEARIAPPPRNPRRELVRALEDRLAGAARFHQTIGYSFVEQRVVDALGLASLSHVEVVNPVAEGLARVRRSVAPSVLAAFAANRRRRDEVRLFEIGKGYLPERANARGEPTELHELAILWGGATPAAGERFDVTRAARLAGVVDDLLWSLGLGRARFGACPEEERPAWAHPARSRSLAVDVAARDPARPAAPHPVGILAPLDPLRARDLGLEGEWRSEVALALISLDRLLECPAAATRFRPLPTHPSVKVDVALALPEAVPAADVLAALQRAGKGLVESAQLFDVYRGERLGSGLRSLAWHVELLAPDRTLDEGDVQKFLGRVEREAAALGGELRREAPSAGS